MLNSIHSDLIRGHIDTIILSVLHEGDRYGYDILGEIERKSGGTYVLKQPTLYSCLKRLETQGFIYKYWGTETNGGRRTYYSLTEMGKELFQKNKDEWKHSRGVIDKLISTPDDSTVVEIVEVPVADNSDTVNPQNELALSENEGAVESDISNATATETIYVESENNADSISPKEAESFDIVPDDYSRVLADAEKNEILAAPDTPHEEYFDRIAGFSYADRLANDQNADDKSDNSADAEHIDESNSAPLFALDYFSDEFDSKEEIDDDTLDEDDLQAPYPTQAFYKDDDFSTEGTDQADRTQNIDKPVESVFKRYENAELSEELNREIVVGREYLSVIRRLLSGDTDADTYYSRLREVGATAAHEEPVIEERREQTYVVTETQPPLDQNANGDDVNFDDLLVSVRSMGDEIRIRTHNRTIDKEYNKLYHFYSNKLLLFKYGALFALMILEIVIPYFVIKFGFNISPIVGELPILVLSVVGAALLPIYAISAYLIDPYKRKRYDFDLKSSLLYRVGIMFLMFILIYAVNVVFRMDISFEAEYAFGLITPVLLSTNIPLSAVVFKVLYDSKQFAAE